MTRLVTIAGLAALAAVGAGCTNDYDRPYYGYSQGYASPGYGYYAPAPYPTPAPAYGYGYPRYGYANPYYGPYGGGGPGITFSASFPQGG